jgi:hypothetical protein
MKTTVNNAPQKIVYEGMHVQGQLYVSTSESSMVLLCTKTQIDPLYFEGTFLNGIDGLPYHSLSIVSTCWKPFYGTITLES